MSDVASAVGTAVSPIIGTLVMLAAFTAVVVVFAAFLTIVRKNKK